MPKFSDTNKGATGEPIAKSNKARQILSDAYRLALHREVMDNLDGDGNPKLAAAVIAQKVVDEAIDGNMIAAKELADRTEGKAAQAIVLQGDEDNPVVSKIVVEIID